MNNTRLTDDRFFTECLDPSAEELAGLAELAKRGSGEEAVRRFAAYVRKTLRPDRYLRGEKERLTPQAERIAEACRRAMAHTFVSCRVPHTFGETIDWTANPTYNNYCEWPWQLNRHPEWLAMAEEYPRFSTCACIETSKAETGSSGLDKRWSNTSILSCNSLILIKIRSLFILHSLFLSPECHSIRKFFSKVLKS